MAFKGAGTRMKPVLSICMMVKNEAGNLPRCLESLKPLMTAVSSELIVVDTGSNDDTVEIARRYTDKIYFHPWNNNFSEMRNITIGYATGRWLLIIDADEELLSHQSLVKFLNKKHPADIVGAAMFVRNHTSDTQWVVLNSPRIFRNDGKMHYKGAIHNTPVIVGGIEVTDAIIAHYGYLSTDKDLMERKFQRTSTILKSELERDPDNIYYLFQLSTTYAMHNDNEESLAEIVKAYELLKKDANPKGYVYVYCQYAKCCVNTGRDQKAEEICLEGIGLEEEYLDLYFFLAQAQANNEKYNAAIDSFEKFLSLVDNFDDLKIKYNPVINHHTICAANEARYNLAVLYRKTGQYDKALATLKTVTIDRGAVAENTVIMAAELSFRLTDFSLLADTYRTLQQEGKNDLLNILIEKSEQYKDVRQEAAYKAYAGSLAGLPGPYGALSHLRCVFLENRPQSEPLAKFLAGKDLSSLPDYYGELLYFSMKAGGAVAADFATVPESKIIGFLGYLDTTYSAARLSDDILSYLSSPAAGSVGDYNTVRMKKMLLKYVLLAHTLDDQRYGEIFRDYLDAGGQFVSRLYSAAAIDDERIYDVRSIEDAFLMYVVKAFKNPQDNLWVVKHLRKAVEVFPAMARGIRLLAADLQTAAPALSKEMAQLRAELVRNIANLAADGKHDDALALIAECEEIAGPGPDTLQLKADILLAADRTGKVRPEN